MTPVLIGVRSGIEARLTLLTIVTAVQQKRVISAMQTYTVEMYMDNRPGQRRTLPWRGRHAPIGSIVLENALCFKAGFSLQISMVLGTNMRRPKWSGGTIYRWHILFSGFRVNHSNYDACYLSLPLKQLCMMSCVRETSHSPLHAEKMENGRYVSLIL